MIEVSILDVIAPFAMQDEPNTCMPINVVAPKASVVGVMFEFVCLTFCVFCFCDPTKVNIVHYHSFQKLLIFSGIGKVTGIMGRNDKWVVIKKLIYESFLMFNVIQVVAD